MDRWEVYRWRLRRGGAVISRYARMEQVRYYSSNERRSYKIVYSFLHLVKSSTAVVIVFTSVGYILLHQFPDVD
jgi:hypothetical protein